MKQETIENIKWLKDLLDREAEIEPVNENDEEYVSDYKKRCEDCKKLLDSLEELENQLKHGGFIPDRNGKPCKDGDKIEICLDGLRSGELVYGRLRWDDKHYQFLCEGDDISLSPGEKEDDDYSGIQWFEKED